MQQAIRYRKYPLYITHIQSHIVLLGPLAQGNEEIDQLLIGNMLEASKRHEKQYLNSKGLKEQFLSPDNKPRKL